MRSDSLNGLGSGERATLRILGAGPEQRRHSLVGSRDRPDADERSQS